MPHSRDADFGDFRTEFGVGSTEDLGYFPKFVQLETINGCNAKCTMCSVADWQRDKGVMPNALFENILAELTEYRDWVEQVTLQLGGEPLLDKQLESRIAALKAAGIKSVAFTTNGSLLSEARARRLLEAGVDTVDFSIDGTTAETFESIRHGLSFEAVRENVLRFLEVREVLDRRTAVRVRLVIQPENAREFDDFVRGWRPLLGPGDWVVGRLLNWWASWRSDLADVPSDYLWEERPPIELNALPCLSPFATINVLADGRVPLCCLDYNAVEAMGDVSKSSIAEVWRGPVFQDVRARHLSAGRAALDFCKDCHIFASGSGFDYAGLRAV